jgi:hypothetical protein
MMDIGGDTLIAILMMRDAFDEFCAITFDLLHDGLSLLEDPSHDMINAINNKGLYDQKLENKIC